MPSLNLRNLFRQDLAAPSLRERAAAHRARAAHQPGGGGSYQSTVRLTHGVSFRFWI